MLFQMSFLSASISNCGGEGARESDCLVWLILVVLVVCSVVMELLVDVLSLLRVFLLVIAGKLLGLKRYFLFVLWVGGLLNCLLVSF